MIKLHEPAILYDWARRIVESAPPDVVIDRYLTDRAYPLDLRVAIARQLMPNEKIPKKLVEIMENESTPD